MSIKIIYQGFLQETSSADAIAVLTKVLKGNQAKAEEAFFSKDFVLQTVNSEAELPLILPRLEKMGIRCKWVNDDEFQAEAMDAQAAAFVRIVTCPACGHQQMPADACRECHQSFVVKRTITPKANDTSPIKQSSQPQNNEDTSLQEKLSGLGLPFSLPSPRILFVLAAALLLIISGAGTKLMGGGSNGEQSSNPILALIGGIMTSDPNEVGKTAKYDPESGKNPYADKLKSLGIDQKKFSSSTGVEGGTLEKEQINAQIDKTPGMRDAIDRATAKSASSASNTEQDKKIEAATGESPAVE